MRNWKSVLLAGASALLLSGPCPVCAAERPNIVLILADDLGFGDLGCYGATRIATPNVDRLAASGLRLTGAYAPASTCTPSRYSIMTGEYAWRQKARKTTILDGDAPLAIEPGRSTLPELLRRAGYRTGVVGKWHLGLGDGQTPVNFNGEIKPGPCEVGFDQACIIPATVDRVPSVWIENHRVLGLDPSDPITVSYATNLSDEPTGLQHPELLKQPADKQHACTIINGISRIGYMKGGKAARFKDEELPSMVIKKSKEFIEANRSRPFFLYLGLFEPHVPRTVQSQFRKASQCGIRGDVIAQLDWEVGQVLDTLDRLDLAKNTLVLFTSDNGPIFFDGYFDKSQEDANGHKPAGGLRGWKYLVFEGGTRVPFIARWPGHIQPGQSDRMLCLTDLLATCAAAAHQTVPSGAGVDSIDQLPMLMGQAQLELRREVIQQGISGAIAIRQGQWKYIPANTNAGASGMGSGADPNDSRFKEAIIQEPLLFDLSKDPGETHNLATSNTRKAAQLRQRLTRIQAAAQQ